MIFDREELIKRVEETIARKHVEAAKKHDKYLNDWHDELETWHDRYHAAWLAYAENLIRVLDKGDPVTHENGKPPQYSEGTGWRGSAYLQHPERPKFEPARVEDLIALRTALKAVTDKNVSQTALERCGFTKLKNMGLFG